MNNTAPNSDVPWLTDHERVAWMSLMSLLMSLPAAIDAQLKRDSGLNFFEYSILSALSRPPGRPVRMNVLALFAGGSASRLSHAVSRLERQGWVRRVVHSSEVRCTEAMLTEKGFAVLSAAAPDHVREARRLVFDAITPEQVEQLRQISRQLVEASSPEVATALDRAIVEAAAVDEAAPDQAVVATTAGSRCTAPEHLGADQGHAGADHAGSECPGADHAGSECPGADHAGSECLGADHAGSECPDVDRAGSVERVRAER